jgi:succinyl-CoA synthetase beta subunit
MFGVGGSDIGGDVTFRLLPTSSRQVQVLLERYGIAGDALPSLHDMIGSFGQIIATRPDIVSLDLNPVTIVDGSVVVLDAKIHKGSSPST